MKPLGLCFLSSVVYESWFEDIRYLLRHIIIIWERIISISFKTPEHVCSDKGITLQINLTSAMHQPHRGKAYHIISSVVYQTNIYILFSYGLHFLLQVSFLNNLSHSLLMGNVPEEVTFAVWVAV